MRCQPFKNYILFTVSLITLWSCQREHSNIFDPQNTIDSLDLNLRITRADSVIRLAWHAPYDVEIQGYNLFRKQSSEADFKQIDFINRNQTSYIDLDVQLQETYKYYLTVQGSDISSVPTSVVTITPGPDAFWILDFWNFYVLKLSYDLSQVLDRHYAIWRPRELAFNSDESKAIITYPEYQYIEFFDVKIDSFIRGFDELERPWATVYDALNNQFWLSDTTGGIYTINEYTYEINRVNASINKPIQLQLDADNRLFVLDAGNHQILILSETGAVIKQIDGIVGKPFYFDINVKSKILYALAEVDETSFLYAVSLQDTSVQLLYQMDKMTRVRHSPVDESVWVAINSDSSASLLQLSAEGSRLYTLEMFNYISDFRISKKTGNLIIADGGEKTVKHIQADGTLIGKSTEAYYPYRVYIR